MHAGVVVGAELMTRLHVCTDVLEGSHGTGIRRTSLKPPRLVVRTKQEHVASDPPTFILHGEVDGRDDGVVHGLNQRRTLVIIQ